MKAELTEYIEECHICKQEVPLIEITGLFNRGFALSKHCVLGKRCEGSGALTEELKRKGSIGAFGI